MMVKNAMFAFCKNQIPKLWNKSPYNKRRIERKASRVNQPREIII